MKHLINGFIIGIANIIPGVSGGTFALILGIYPQLLRAVSNFNLAFAGSLMNALKSKNIQKIKELLVTRDLLFLTQIFSGALISIALLSRLMKYLLETHYEATYGFFLGLIAFSVYIPYKLVDEKKMTHFLWLFAGMALTLIISFEVDPSVKMIEKSLYYKEIMMGGNPATALTEFSLMEYAVIFLNGILVISAMVLPGISGSFILLLFGRYYQVIAAISRLHHLYMEDILLISFFGVGCIIGLAGFVKLFNFVYSKFKNQTVFFLIGLMIGSVHALWPFKKYQFIDLYVKNNTAISIMPRFKVYTNQLKLYEDFSQLWPVLLSFSLGSVIMLIFIQYEKRHKNGNKE